MNDLSRAVTGIAAAISAILLALVLGSVARAYEPPPIIVPPTSVTEPDARDGDDVAAIDTTEAPTVPQAGPMCLDGRSEAVTWGRAPTALGLLLLGEPTPSEREIVTRAIDGCSQTNRAVADPWLVLALVRLADEAGAPPLMLVSAWCVESSMRTTSARDDGPIKGDPDGGVWRARGPLQLHDWWPAWCGGASSDRDDLVWSAGCYLRRVVAYLPQFAECPEPWRVSEAMAANARAYAPRGCAARSKHWRVMLDMEH